MLEEINLTDGLESDEFLDIDEELPFEITFLEAPGGSRHCARCILQGMRACMDAKCRAHERRDGKTGYYIVNN